MKEGCSMNEGKALGLVLANHHPAFWFLIGVTLILAALAYPFYLLYHRWPIPLKGLLHR